jgi:hypothetical protein
MVGTEVVPPMNLRRDTEKRHGEETGRKDREKRRETRHTC